jgi:hypothetical protein
MFSSDRFSAYIWISLHSINQQTLRNLDLQEILQNKPPQSTTRPPNQPPNPTPQKPEHTSKPNPSTPRNLHNPTPLSPRIKNTPNPTKKATMQRNIVIAVIIIVLFILLTLLGFLIWWIQNGFPRRGGGGSYTDDEESAHWGMMMATRDKRYKHEEHVKREKWREMKQGICFVKERLHEAWWSFLGF